MQQLVDHLRCMHKKGATANSKEPRRDEVSELNNYLASVGFWYCHPHKKYLPSVVSPKPDKNGLYTFRYKACQECPGYTGPARYRPLQTLQLKLDKNLSLDKQIARIEQEAEQAQSAHRPTRAAPASGNEGTAQVAQVKQPAPQQEEDRITPVQQPPPPVPAPVPVPAEDERAPLPRQELPSLQDICTTHIPIISHIPNRHRAALATVLSKVMWEAARATQDSTAAVNAFKKLLLFPAALLASPKKTSKVVQKGNASNSQIFRRRIELWEQGQFQTLWKEAHPLSSARAYTKLSAEQQKVSNARRAVRLAKEGAYGKAVQALQSVGVAPDSEQTAEALLAKHPQQVPPEQTGVYTPPEISPAAPEFTEEQVRASVKRFPPGSAAGGSGLRPNHLLELLDVPNPKENAGLLAGLTRVVNLLAAGKAPKSISAWIAGAPLTALLKEDNGIRPIAVGETLRRIVSNCLMTSVSQEAREYFQPLQLGIATSGGTEAIVHSVRRTIKAHGKDKRYALLTVDLKNAFNLVSRASFLEQIKEHFPTLLPWVEYCYHVDKPFLWFGETLLLSVIGSQQGDGLGGLLFAVAAHPFVVKIKELVEAGSLDQETAALLLTAWFFDDGYISGTHEQLVKVLEFLSSEEAKACGLYVRVDKCKIYWPTAPSDEVQASYPPDVKQEYSDGFYILKAPVGTTEFMEREFSQHIQELKSLIDAILELEDSHVAFQLFRSCLGVCRINYLLRVIPTKATLKGAEEFDELMENALRRLIGGVLDKDIFKELQLPVKDISKNTPTFGVGITSAVHTAASAFLASCSLTRKLCNELPGTRSTTPLSEDEEVRETYEIYRQQCLQDRAIPLSEIDSDQTPAQRALTARVYEKALQDIPPGDQRTQAFRSSLALPGSKNWLKCSPSPGLGTYISDRDFKVWFQYFCRVPLYAQDAKCPRCSKDMDQYGDHLLYCPNGAPRGWRHDSQVMLLASDLSKAARHPIVEPPQGTHKVRPDIKALGSNGGTDFYDVVFVHPLTDARLQAVARNPTQPLQHARHHKLRHYSAFLQSQGPGSRLVPIPVSTLGGWHPEAYGFVAGLAESIASRAMMPRSFARQAMFCRHAARMVRNNANCLLDGVQVEI